MKTCEDYIADMNLSIDGLLTPEEEQALQAHLADCPKCRSLYQSYRDIQAAIDEAEVEPPKGLAHSVMTQIHQEKVRHSPKATLKRMRFTLVAAVLALVVIAAGKYIGTPHGNTAVSSTPETAAAEAPAEAAANPEAALAAPPEEAAGAAAENATAAADEDIVGLASGWQPMAAHQVKVSLAPGEERRFNFVLGYVEVPQAEKFVAPSVINKAPAKALLEKLTTDEQIADAFNALKKHWDNLLSAYVLTTPDEKLGRMVNIWNPYQCMVTFNMSRSTSMFESGIGRGMGFRDSSQDLLGFVHQIPERARERILDIAATQFRDGGCYHQYQPLTKKGNNDIGGGFNDDPLWLIAGTAAYIKETGDFGILDAATPYDCNPDDCGTLLEHLEASFYHVVNNKGPHGLPLIGRADWNDCLNLNCFSDEPSESFQTFSNPNAPDERVAESVLIAGMFVAIGPDLVAILRRRGLDDKADACQKEIDAMNEAILRDGWDGEWFVRAYDAFGHKIGSKECKDGKIYIESQGYCVMGGVGVKDGKAEKALESVHKYLETKHGIVLLQPAYKEYHLELGEVSSYPPGYKENAGIFCHNNPWIIAAETVVGHGDRAFDLYSRIAPAYREEISDLHKMEPYVYSQMIAGKDAPNFGQAKNSWLTGTAAWNFYVISNYILGIKPDWEGLKIDPCIPHTWDGYQVSRRFRGATYAIAIENPSHVCRGVKQVTVDGQAIAGNVLPVFADGKTHQVTVTLG